MAVGGKPGYVAQMATQYKSRLKDESLGSFYFMMLQCSDTGGLRFKKNERSMLK